jgi:hypothetical protein
VKNNNVAAKKTPNLAPTRLEWRGVPGNRRGITGEEWVTGEGREERRKPWRRKRRERKEVHGRGYKYPSENFRKFRKFLDRSENLQKHFDGSGNFRNNSEKTWEANKNPFLKGFAPEF